jgi:hypothetical protein
MTAPVPIAGRVTITRRALSAVLAAVAAERLGVRSTRVRVDLADDRTRLGVAITSTARVDAAGGAVPSLRDLGAAVRNAVQADGARITGSEIGRVTVRITGHELVERRTR